MKKDHLEILLEDIRGNVQLVLKGHVVLDRKIDTKFNELSEKIDINSLKIDALNGKIDAVDKKLSDKIDDVAADLKAHRADTEAHPPSLQPVCVFCVRLRLIYGSCAGHPKKYFAVNRAVFHVPKEKNDEKTLSHCN